MIKAAKSLWKDARSLEGEEEDWKRRGAVERVDQMPTDCLVTARADRLMGPWRDASIMNGGERESDAKT